ncbi:MAG: hypothetical protein ACK45Y_13700 [Betaproteobacteria bacterium]|jgi:hypothetical protein
MSSAREEILVAFPLRPIPYTVFVYPAEYDDIAESLWQKFSGKQWDAITLMDWRMVESIEVAKRYFSPEGFAYFVPSILLGSLEDSLFLSYGLEAIIPSNQKRTAKGDWWNLYRKLFSNVQADAIHAFLFEAMSLCSSGSEEEAMVDCAVSIWSIPTTQ